MKALLPRIWLKRTLAPEVIVQLRRGERLARLAWHDLRRELLGPVWPLKPSAISFMVNDICNAKCVMCLIWQRKKDREISVEEFRQVLREPLFSRIEHIGFTGGEPTLRKDLPELMRAAVEHRPRLHGVSLITNAIKERQVCERILECFAICREQNLYFSVMVSLDGLGEIHDANRGRAGNFATAVNCVQTLSAAGLPVSIGCTITKDNAAALDELLDWAIEHNIPARFRVAEFIDRLYNTGQIQHIRNFSPLERHHLGLFFRRLIATYEPDQAVRKTYASILGMLTEGRKRSTGCPHQTEAVVLTARGEMLYCSPRSPSLGSILSTGAAARAYFGQLRIRREIRRQHCDDCIHDYHAPVSFREKTGLYLEHRRRRRVYRSQRLIQRAQALRQPRAAPLDPRTLASRRVLIVGWYGTETAGDKAILWRIVSEMRSRARPPAVIEVSSFAPWFTRWSVQELGLGDLTVTETYSAQFEQACRKADEIVIGGGPLMDLDALDHMLYAFVAAARRGAVARIAGCGLGPLRQPTCKRLVGELLRLAAHVSLRDTGSAARARDDFGIRAELAEDPACAYVRHLRARAPVPSPGPRPLVNFLLREWPRMYYPGEADAYHDLKQRLESALLDMARSLILAHGFDVRFLAMSTFADGLDDRVYNRRLARQLTQHGQIPQVRIQTPALPMAPADILMAMRQSHLNVCMRYHAVLFAQELGKEFLAVDYSCGGKIENFLRDQGEMKRLLSVEQFAGGAWRQYLPGAAANRARTAG